jgi:indolepyruvate ferredoxin oxidoreductase
MDRETSSLIQMGGEGVNWAASSRFTGKGHIFQNLGEGTWYHSGSMAIRQAVAAKANITYKILYNDAVAMTGGQPVDGPVSVEAIAHVARAEGVERIAVVSDQPEKFDVTRFPAGTTLDHRRSLDPIQRELREAPGVSVLIYEQTCATEKRRRRKRGRMEDPARFAVINELVCEGCGDCSVESNCLSVEPKETPFGRKRRINLSSCNKDFSCLNGFCPSFVTVEGARRRKKGASGGDFAARAAKLPPPAAATLEKPYDLLVTGVGGTGVVTIGAIVTMAAHLEGKGASVLDFTGFAQKFGPVLSYIRLAATPDRINQVGIDEASADALIGCDLVVSSSPKASAAYHPGTRAVINTAEMPTGDLVRFRDADLRAMTRFDAIRDVLGEANVDAIDANRLAEKLFGDAVYSNMLLLGFGWQRGLAPVSLEALSRAIELNGVEIEKNHAAFAAGRLAAMGEELATDSAEEGWRMETLDQVIARREAFLKDYQNTAWAARYRAVVDRVRAAERLHDSEALTQAVARSLFKLMSYKDEYEVARLHMRTGFLEKLKEEFEGDFKVNYHLAPPILPLGHDARGRPNKKAFGQWMQGPFRILARLKFLRGTAFDPFGYTAERRCERELIGWYEGVVETLLSSFGKGDITAVAAIAAAPMEIRGYGPVKEKAIVEVKADVAVRLAALQKPGKARNAEPVIA